MGEISSCPGRCDRGDGVGLDVRDQVRRLPSGLAMLPCSVLGTEGERRRGGVLALESNEAREDRVGWAGKGTVTRLCGGTEWGIDDTMGD